MTPGQEALAEAARLETARIYSQLQREREQPVEKVVDNTAVTVRPAAVDETPKPRAVQRKLVDRDRVDELRRRYYKRTA